MVALALEQFFARTVRNTQRLIAKVQVAFFKATSRAARQARAILSGTNVTGWKRRRAIGVLAACAAMLCAFLALSGGFSDLTTALAIFLISTLTFTAIALLSFDCSIGWRAVDFPWVLVSFATVIVALTSIADAARRESLYRAKVQASQAFAGLIYSAQSTVTNDCDELPSRARMWTRSPEPYEGACDRLRHFLPQMQNQYNDFTTLPNEPIPTGWGMNVHVDDSAAKGSWAGLNMGAARFNMAVSAYETARERYKPASGPLERALLGNHLKYWYFLIAFFVGLRLSKTTSEVLLSRHSARQPKR